MVGFLRYLCSTRPYLNFGVGLISGFMHNPKKVLRYQSGTTDFGIVFLKKKVNEGVELVGYNDAY